MPLALIFAFALSASPPPKSHEVSPSKILPASATGGSSSETSKTKEYERYPDPKECSVVIDSIGRVGFRIADAQGLTERVLKEFRKRLGRAGVVYEGTLIADKRMTRMLDGSESEIRAEKMEYYRKAIKYADRRVKMKFGKKKGKHWVKLTCRNEGSKKSLDTTRVTAKKWQEAMQKLDKALPSFCMQIGPKKATLSEAQKKAISAAKKKAAKAKKRKSWSMPPRRD